jgi:uncharacterized membrane protein
MVKWTNDDVFPHVIRFTEAGIYACTCTLHPGMSAVVFVGAVLVGVTGFGAGRYLGR